MRSAEMLSTGIDLVEICRIKRSMKNPRFCQRILGAAEYSQLQKRGFPVPSVAASFSAKEAFSKAMGTGVRGFRLSDVELLRDEMGKPYFMLHNGALAMALKKGYTFSVSVTHTKEYASAVVIAVCEQQGKEYTV